MTPRGGGGSGEGLLPLRKNRPLVSPADCESERSEKLYLGAVWKEYLAAGWTLNYHDKQNSFLSITYHCDNLCAIKLGKGYPTSYMSLKFAFLGTGYFL